MRYILLLILSGFFTLLQAQYDCVNGEADGYACSNVDLLSHLSLGELGGPNNANDIWGWVDSFNNDAYALVGLETGTAFVRITDPVNPLVIGYLGTHSSASLWRDIKVVLPVNKICIRHIACRRNQTVNINFCSITKKNTIAVYQH